MRYLTVKGHRVLVIDDLSTGLYSKDLFDKHPLVRFWKADLCTLDFRKLDGWQIKGVFHLAGAGRVRQSFIEEQQFYRANVFATEKVVEFVKIRDIPRLVFASSSSVYGGQRVDILHENLPPNPISPYGEQKLEAEKLVLEVNNGSKAVALRLFSVFGPGQRADLPHCQLVPAILRSISAHQPLPIHGTGDHRRDFTYLPDVISAFYHAMVGPMTTSEALNIGAGNNYSVREVVEGIEKITGSKVIKSHQPNLLEPYQTLASIEKARKLLGWQPQFDLISGLKDMLLKGKSVSPEKMGYSG